jgi:hypothetical protein
LASFYSRLRIALGNFCVQLLYIDAVEPHRRHLLQQRQWFPHFFKDNVVNDPSYGSVFILPNYLNVPGCGLDCSLGRLGGSISISVCFRLGFPAALAAASTASVAAVAAAPDMSSDAHRDARRKVRALPCAGRAKSLQWLEQGSCCSGQQNGVAIEIHEVQERPLLPQRCMFKLVDANKRTS